MALSSGPSWRSSSRISNSFSSRHTASIYNYTFKGEKGLYLNDALFYNIYFINKINFKNTYIYVSSFLRFSLCGIHIYICVCVCLVSQCICNIVLYIHIRRPPRRSCVSEHGLLLRLHRLLTQTSTDSHRLPQKS